MNFAANSTLPEVTRVLTALALVCLITFVAFVTSDSLVRVLGQNASKVVSRLMGLILAVIGVQMVIEGGAAARSRRREKTPIDPGSEQSPSCAGRTPVSDQTSKL